MAHPARTLPSHGAGLGSPCLIGTAYPQPSGHQNCCLDVATVLTVPPTQAMAAGHTEWVVKSGVEFYVCSFLKLFPSPGLGSGRVNF